MSMKTFFGAATAALMLAAIPVSAQTPGSSSEAVAYGADAGEYTPAGFTLRGRAEVVQGRNRLRADAINGFVSDGDLRRVEASGNVYFVTPDQTMRGDRAVYTLASNEVVVTGDVILTQGQNVLTGGRLVYNTRTEAARMEGPANGRIRGVFYPQNSGN
jgi:lipopolysaccharide export system protein LptA